MPASDIRTPVTILTGFLGSGKTTLLNRALRDPAMARAAVVINEFGTVSIDHSLTAASNDKILVLENGCLCCTVFGDLVLTLNTLYHTREAGEIDFDRVIVETSGLADMTPVIQAFLSDPTLEGLYRVTTAIATLDAINGDSTLSEHDVAVRQVALADYVLLTKLDLVPEASRSEVRAALTRRLRKFNKIAVIASVQDEGIDPVQLMRNPGHDPSKGTDAIKEWLRADASESHVDHDHSHATHEHDSTIASYSLVRDQPVPREALQLLLNSVEKHLGPALLRVKGLVNVLEEPNQPAVIQGAQHLLHNLTWLEKWPDDDRRTRIVFITQGIAIEDLDEMLNLLDRVAQRTAAARLRASLTPS